MNTVADILSGLSILAASVYGFALLTKSPSGPRTAIKAASVACIADVFYIALFAHQGLGYNPFLADPARWVPALAVAVAAGFTLRWIWPSLNRLREAVVIYTAIIVVMVVMAFTLPWTRSAAMIGAVLFMISDGILAVRLFKAGGPNITADLAVWWFYWAAQALIARAFLHAA
jgi:uncharacterized membrane protein YhhN